MSSHSSFTQFKHKGFGLVLIEAGADEWTLLRWRYLEDWKEVYLKNISSPREMNHLNQNIPKITS